jgi:hypothetical protein
MPSPRLLKLLAEGLSEAPQGLRRASQELPAALLEGLKKTPELAEALLQVLGKVKAKAPGIADALQEAATSFLSGQKTPEMIRKAKEARSIAVGEHILGTGRKQVGLEVAEAPKRVPDISEGSPFVPVNRPPASPEIPAGPRTLKQEDYVRAKVGKANVQLNPAEQDLFMREAFKPDLGVLSKSAVQKMANARKRLGIQEPQVPSQSIKAEPEVVPPGKQLYKSPKGSG